MRHKCSAFDCSLGKQFNITPQASEFFAFEFTLGISNRIEFLQRSLRSIYFELRTSKIISRSYFTDKKTKTVRRKQAQSSY